MKAIAGSILMGLSLVAHILSNGLGMISYNITTIENTWGGIYTKEAGIVLLVWIFMGIGLILLIWGLFDIEVEIRRKLRSKYD